MIKPPFNYTGNKNRLIDEFATRLFPKKKELKFLDVFGGGGTISINVDYKFIHYNDISNWVPETIKILKKTPIKDILVSIKNIIDKYNLSSTHFYGQMKYREFRTGNQGLKNFNEDGYYKLRNSINAKLLNKENTNETFLEILTLMFYSFNNDIRFNSKGLINIPIGKTDFNSQSYDKLITFSEAIKRKNIKVSKRDFRKLSFQNFDFIYADPPYLLSEATYNNNWTKKEEMDLYKKLKEFSENGGKFVLSNVLFSKGKKHSMLEKWANANNFTIHKLNYSYKAASYNRNRIDKDLEVVVTNV